MKRNLMMVMLVPLLSYAGEGTGLSLEDAIAVGLAQSRTLRASSARADAAEARAGEARTARLPVLKGEASYRRLSEVDPFQIQLPGASKPIEISPVVLDNSVMRVSVQQPLFTGFRISSSIESAELGAEAASLDNVNDRTDMVFAITSAYWSLYQTREVEHFTHENVARLEHYRADADQLMKAGLATRNDVLKIEVQLSNARIGTDGRGERCASCSNEPEHTARAGRWICPWTCCHVQQTTPASPPRRGFSHARAP